MMYRTLSVLMMAMLAAGGLQAQEDAKKNENQRRRGNQTKHLLERYAPSVVTVKAILKIEISMMGQGEEQESEVEVEGIAVAADIVMIASASLNPMGALSGPFEVDVTPQEMKVIIGNEDKTYKAEVATEDTKLGFTYLRVSDLGDRKLTPLSLDESSRAGVGSRVASVRRLGKGYDYAPYVATTRIAGQIKKPRRAMILEGSASAGMPVFAMNGKVVGIVTKIESSEDSDDEIGGMLSMISRMGGGGGGGLGGRSFVIPAKIAKKAIEQATAQAAQAPKDDAKSEPEKSDG